MPVRVGKCGNKWCVKDPDGTTVPGGEHDTEGEANAHAAAINANTEKHIMSDETYIQETDTDNTSGSFTITTTGTASTHTISFPALEPQIQKAIKDKGLEEALMFGPESFEDLDLLREHSEQQNGILKMINDFMALAGNILNWGYPDQGGKLKKLAQDLADRLPEDDELLPRRDEDLEEEKEKETETEIEDEVDNAHGNGFFVWKDAETGEYRWLGVYSNKFRDDDRPAEILAEQAHIDFIERVEKGDLPYPDLYVWHIKSPIGKADLLAYDDSGFSIAAGTIQEDFALALMKSEEDWAMSHGMPSEFIKRAEDDPTVITAYVSTEVSVLPRRAAANKRTDFRILKEEAMAIVPADKRAEVADLLGEDLTTQLEEGLDLTAKAAHEANVESKEETPDSVGAEDNQGETEEKTEEIEPAGDVEGAEEPETETLEKEEEVEEPEAATSAEVQAEDIPAEDGAGEVTGEEEGATEKASETELAAVLAAALNPLLESQAQLVEMIGQQNDRIKALEQEQEEKQAEPASEPAGELAEGTPQASLMEQFMKQLSTPAKSVIGTKEAAVHGNANLAKAKPKETENEEGAPEQGLFWKAFS